MAETAPGAIAPNLATIPAILQATVLAELMSTYCFGIFSRGKGWQPCVVQRAHKRETGLRLLMKRRRSARALVFRKWSRAKVIRSLHSSYAVFRWIAGKLACIVQYQLVTAGRKLGP